MTYSNETPIALAPFADLPIASSESRGVIVSDRDGMGLATVLVRKGRDEVLAQRLREHFALELPRGPRRATAGDVALIGTAPGGWLATQERGGNTFYSSLKEKLGDAASVSDQSDGYAVLRVGGPKAREALAKLFSVDLHPRAFAPGDVSVTGAAHMGATIWRLEDGADGASRFEIAVFRSLAENFWGVLSESAAEFGMVGV